MDKDSVVKLNSEKELTVNISSLEDLLNSIKYATSKMEKAKEGLGGFELNKDFSYIKDKLDLVLDKQTALRDVVFYDFEKDVKKSISSLPKEDTLQALMFELNRFNKVDVILNKISIKNTIITSIVMSVLVAVAIIATKITDEKIQAYHKAAFAKEYFMFSKNGFELSENSTNSVYTLRKKIN